MILLLKAIRCLPQKHKAEESEVELVEPEAELPKVPKPKKKSFQNEIDVATKELEEAKAKKFSGRTTQGEEPEGKNDES
jgi:hypothetical protein